MSHIAQQRALFAKNRQIVQQLLGWDDLAYCTFQFESGIIYLEEILGLHDFEYKMLSREELFWKWWINQWNLTDSVMVPTLQNLSQPLTVKGYVHNHTMAMVDKHPSNLILEESYAKFIGEFNDKHNSHAT